MAGVAANVRDAPLDIVLKETDDQPAGIWGRIHAATADELLGPYSLVSAHSLTIIRIPKG